MNTYLYRKEFGQRLREERNRLNLTQDAMAVAGGVTRATQFLYEKGERSPNVDYLAQINAEGVDYRYLITGERPAPLGGKICLSPEILIKVFNLVDEASRDSKGRLLDREHRASMMVSICQRLADEKPDNIDWNAISDNQTEAS